MLGGSGFRLAAVLDDPDTTEEDESQPQTARKIADLGVFTGYELWEDDGVSTTDDRARVIAFTDKVKGKDSVLAVTAVPGREVTNFAVSGGTVNKLGTKSGNGYTGAEFTIDKDDNGALNGTLACPSGATCSVDTTTNADGSVTVNTVTGYRFSGSRPPVAGVTGVDRPTENAEYLIFGLWMDETTAGEGSGMDRFGSFANGGTRRTAVVPTTLRRDGDIQRQRCGCEVDGEGGRLFLRHCHLESQLR